MPEGPYWLDAPLPPQLAPWLTQRFGVPAYSASYLGYRDASDDEIFQAAREARAVVVSKDSDFLDRVTRLGPPPQLKPTACWGKANPWWRSGTGKVESREDRREDMDVLKCRAFTSLEWVKVVLQWAVACAHPWLSRLQPLQPSCTRRSGPS